MSLKQPLSSTTKHHVGKSFQDYSTMLISHMDGNYPTYFLLCNVLVQALSLVETGTLLETHSLQGTDTALYISEGRSVSRLSSPLTPFF